jgi:polyisoprenoid-binding protein YceI
MKTKYLTLIAAIAIAFTFSACTNEKEAEETHTHEDGTVHEEDVHDDATAEAVIYQVNIEESLVGWTGSMVGFYDHSGDIFLSEGSLSLSDGKVTEGTFVVDMSTMVTTDDDALYKVAPREKLIEHLSNDDFFSVDDFPTSTFVVKSHEGNTLVGDLSIKDVTSEETVTDVVISEEAGTLKASGKLVFDRKKYNVSYVHKMKDKVISDEIVLDIELTAVK